jgi:hypothetical protein
LSIIKTCALNSINPYDYLVAIQANVDEVRKHPDAWLPWNYSENAKMPYVQSQSVSAEEVYQTNPTGPPITTPRAGIQRRHTLAAVAAFAAFLLVGFNPTLTRNVVKIKKFYGAADANLDSFAPRQYSHRY